MTGRRTPPTDNIVRCERKSGARPEGNYCYQIPRRATIEQLATDERRPHSPGPLAGKPGGWESNGPDGGGGRTWPRWEGVVHGPDGEGIVHGPDGDGVVHGPDGDGVEHGPDGGSYICQMGKESYVPHGGGCRIWHRYLRVVVQ